VPTRWCCGCHRHRWVLRPLGAPLRSVCRRTESSIRGWSYTHTQSARAITPELSGNVKSANEHSQHRSDWHLLMKRNVMSPDRGRRVATGQAAVASSVRHAGVGDVILIAIPPATLPGGCGGVGANAARTGPVRSRTAGRGNGQSPPATRTMLPAAGLEAPVRAAGPRQRSPVHGRPTRVVRPHGEVDPCSGWNWSLSWG
jgi:hypothetical protein